MQKLLEVREGLILVTGPTGSGKTTTLYAALRLLQHRGVNIITVEDPVEYRIPGIVQVQIHEKAGLTFASALRSVLRQDPDVVLIGEIRDRETAAIAIQASLTGHLVLSTLHTNSAIETIIRLLDMGLDSFNFADALLGILGRCDRTLTWINLGFLFVVSLLPFSAALLAHYVHLRLAVGVYWLNILVLGALILAAAEYAARGGLFNKANQGTILRAVRRRVYIAQALYLFATLLCVIDTRLSIAVIVAIQLNYAIAPRVPLLHRL